MREPLIDLPDPPIPQQTEAKSELVLWNSAKDLISASRQGLLRLLERFSRLNEHGRLPFTQLRPGYRITSDGMILPSARRTGRSFSIGEAIRIPYPRRARRTYSDELNRTIVRLAQMIPQINIVCVNPTSRDESWTTRPNRSLIQQRPRGVDRAIPRPRNEMMELYTSLSPTILQLPRGIPEWCECQEAVDRARRMRTSDENENEIYDGSGRAAVWRRAQGTDTSSLRGIGERVIVIDDVSIPFGITRQRDEYAEPFSEGGISEGWRPRRYGINQRVEGQLFNQFGEGDDDLPELESYTFDVPPDESNDNGWIPVVEQYQSDDYVPTGLTIDEARITHDGIEIVNAIIDDDEIREYFEEKDEEMF
jgi:hypothetical protein